MSRIGALSALIFFKRQSSIEKNIIAHTNQKLCKKLFRKRERRGAVSEGFAVLNIIKDNKQTFYKVDVQIPLVLHKVLLRK